MRLGANPEAAGRDYGVSLPHLSNTLLQPPDCPGAPVPSLGREILGEDLGRDWVALGGPCPPLLGRPSWFLTGPGVWVCFPVHLLVSADGPQRFRQLCFPQGGPGEGTSRRLSADPSGCPVISPAKLAARAGPSWLRTWRPGVEGIHRSGRLSPPRTPGSAGSPHCTLPTPCLEQVLKCVHGEAGFGSVRTGVGVVHSTLT